MNLKPDLASNTPAELGFHMPAEWAQHSRCWMAWPCQHAQYQEGAQIASRVLDRLELEAYHSSLVLEGGALHVDPVGTLVTTESVVLNANRNWGMDKTQAEVELCRATGAIKVIWLPGDLNGDTSDMTDGHVDGIHCIIQQQPA